MSTLSLSRINWRSLCFTLHWDTHSFSVASIARTGFRFADRTRLVMLVLVGGRAISVGGASRPGPKLDLIKDQGVEFHSFTQATFEQAQVECLSALRGGSQLLFPALSARAKARVSKSTSTATHSP